MEISYCNYTHDTHYWTSLSHHFFKIKVKKHLFICHLKAYESKIENNIHIKQRLNITYVPD